MTEFQHCHSCAAPLNMAGFAGAHEHFCKYCTGEDGAIITREQAHKNMCHWFRAWQPAMNDAELERRVTAYMNAMPHWATDKPTNS